MIWWLLIIGAVIILCACLSPNKKLRDCALNALDSSGTMVGLGRSSEDEESNDEGMAAAPPRQRPDVVRSASEASAVSTTNRRRVTPFQAKLVAAAQDWRCGCGCRDPDDARGRGQILDANFEIDHHIPTRWGGKHDASNWKAVLRAHHTLKSARESSKASRRGRQLRPETKP